jgi:outer membrane receptor protein involved in Fe transport
MGGRQPPAISRGAAARCARRHWPFALLLLCARVGAQALPAEIPPQSLAGAIDTFAQLTGLQVIYFTDIARGHMSKGAPAGLAPAAALARLLEGSGLHAEFLNEHTVRIVATPERSTKAVIEATRATNDTGAVTLEEVFVSAALRNQPASQVPISMGVWTDDTMLASGVKDITALAALTPGVEFDYFPDVGADIETNISIRGVNSKDGSTTAIYFNDTPLVHDRASAFGRAYPVTFDLERVEVLRGPQGVMMGEGAEGGGVRFISAAPSATSSTSLVRGEASFTERGDPSYEIGGVLGGPLVQDAIGYRLSAWIRRDGGFVDHVDPFTGAVVEPNSNWTRTGLVRAAMVFAPTASFQITPSIDYQSMHVNDTSAFYTYMSDPSQGILNNGKLLQQWENDDHRLISVKAAWSLNDAATFSSVTSQFHRQTDAIDDATNNSVRVFPCQNVLGPEYPCSYADAVGLMLNLDQDTFAQQFLYSSARPNARVAWSAGADLIHSHFRERQPLSTTALQDDGNVTDTLEKPDRVINQFAVYGQMDVSIRSRWSAGLGLRVERQSFDSRQVLVYPVTEWTTEFKGQATLVAPRASLSLHASDDGLYYASIAKGYRAGGPNIYVPPPTCPIATPTTYGSDYDWTFELGAKNRLLGGRLRTDVSVYHTIWHDLQIQIPLPGCWFGVIDNEGRAAINGFDLGAEAVVTDHFKARLSAAYTDPRYTTSVYLGDHYSVAKGDSIGSLPVVVAPWNITTAAEYQFNLATGAITRLRVEDVFASRNPGPFSSDDPLDVTYDPTRRPNPSINVLNFRAILSKSRVEVDLFVNNVLDRQPTLFLRNHRAGDTLYYATTLRPRTAGLMWSYSF